MIENKMLKCSKFKCECGTIVRVDNFAQIVKKRKLCDKCRNDRRLDNSKNNAIARRANQKLKNEQLKRTIDKRRRAKELNGIMKANEHRHQRA